MAEFRLSTAAQADFNEIIDYLADVAGNRVAADYAGRLRESVNRVAQFPGIGAPRPHFGTETRITIVKPYVYSTTADRTASACTCSASCTAVATSLLS